MGELIGKFAPEGTYNLLIVNDGLEYNEPYKEGLALTVRVEHYPHPPDSKSFGSYATLLIIRGRLGVVRTEVFGVEPRNIIVLARGEEVDEHGKKHFDPDPPTMLAQLREIISPQS